MENRFLTGSRAFFSGMEGFRPNDVDEIVIVPVGRGFEWVRQTSTGHRCIFEVTDRPVEEHIERALSDVSPGMVLGRFLTPGYAERVGLGVVALQRLRPLTERLDSRHAYLAVILEAYIANGRFELNEGQREEAYAAYRAARNKTEEGAE